MTPVTNDHLTRIETGTDPDTPRRLRFCDRLDGERCAAGHRRVIVACGRAEQSRDAGASGSGDGSTMALDQSVGQFEQRIQLSQHQVRSHGRKAMKGTDDPDGQHRGVLTCARGDRRCRRCGGGGTGSGSPGARGFRLRCRDCLLACRFRHRLPFSCCQAAVRGVDRLQGEGMGQGTRRFGREPIDQGSQDRSPEQMGLVGVRKAPGSSNSRQRASERSSRNPLLSACAACSSSAMSALRQTLRQRVHLPPVEVDRSGPERDLAAVGDQHVLSVDVHDLAELRRSSSQRCPQIVGSVPEQAAEPLASLRLIGHRQIGQQRTGFARGRESQRPALVADGECAQHAQIKHRAGPILLPATVIRPNCLSRHDGCAGGSLPRFWF